MAQPPAHVRGADTDLVVLRALAREPEVSVVARDLALERDAVESRIGRLVDAGFLEVVERSETYELTVTPSGRRALAEGVPERVVVAALREGPRHVVEAIDAVGDSREGHGAVAALVRAGIVTVSPRGLATLVGDPEPMLAAVEAALARVADRDSVRLDSLSADEAAAMLTRRWTRRAKDRGLVRVRRRSHTLVRVTPAGMAFLESDGTHTRRSNEARSRPSARRHPYLAVLDSARRFLVGLGFEEVSGPIVTSSFWNAEALFMPQFHPALDHHHVLSVAEDDAAVDDVPDKLLDAVQRVHEIGGGTGSRGLRYPFDPARARRHVLRSHATEVTARTLAACGREGNGRYFTVCKCFAWTRPGRHRNPDFYMVDGLVVGDDARLPVLFGVLEQFAHEFAGVRGVRFVPTSFPFTEPSYYATASGFRTHDLAGGGLLRPEVTVPLGLAGPAAAFWLGVNRVAMNLLGLDDVRDLYNADLSFLRRLPTPSLRF